MELDQFIKNFADQFDETDFDEFKADTSFKDLDEWSSLTALSLIAMVDAQYGKKISGEDIKSVKTIEELFSLISGRN